MKLFNYTPTEVKRKSPNAWALEFEDGTTVWFSYGTPVALRDGSDVLIAQNQWSASTSTHIKWLTRALKSFKIVPYKLFSDVFYEMFGERPYNWPGK